MAFGDIPVRINDIDSLIDASWFNTIREELINAFGTGGYIKEAAAQNITNGGEITLDAAAFKPMVPVQGDGGAVTVSSTPFGNSHGFSGGKEIVLIGLSDTNTVTLEVNDVTDGVISNGMIVLGRFDFVTLVYVESLERFVRMDIDA